MASNGNFKNIAVSRSLAGWAVALTLLLTPWIAMQFSSQVNWSVADFLVFGLMLLCVGIPLECAARLVRNRTYVAAAATALLGAFGLTWVNLAVGIVGSPHHRANFLFLVALLAGIAGTALGRARAVETSNAMLATATAIAMAFGIAVTGRSDEPNVSHVVEAAGTSVFAALFLLSAWLFRRAAKS